LGRKLPRLLLPSLLGCSFIAAPQTAPASPRVAAALVLGQIPGGSATPSAENEAVGRRHYKRGDELFKAGRFLEAAKEFEAGFAAAPRPLFLLNIGHSYRKGQELRRARQAYEEYLKADPSTPFRADVEDLIKGIDDALSASSLPGVPPPAPASPVAPPPTLPSAATPSPIDLPRPVLIDVEPAPSPPAESGTRPLLKNPWFWGAVGVVVAAGVAGTVYGVTRPPSCKVLRCLRETD
ncbi:MAG TPA: tetratricopeptide repeat protein, partial [Polyangia bacterium]